MSEHLSAQEIERYQARAMPAAQLIAAFDHLSQCGACRGEISSPDQVQMAFAALGPDLHVAARVVATHLLAEQFADYVDNEMGEVDRQTADSHLESCAQCATEMRELGEFKDSLGRVPVTPYFPRKSPMPPKRQVEALRSPARTPAYWVPVQAAMLAAILFLGISALVLRGRLAELSAQVGDLNKTNEVLRDQLSSLAGLQTELKQLRESRDQILAASAVSVVSLNDAGGLVALDQQGRLSGLSLPRSYEKLTTDALSTGRVKVPAMLTELVGKRETLMGSDSGRDPFHARGPVGTIVETDRPVFSWSPLDGASSYRVTVNDASFSQVAVSGPLSATEWIIPRSLKRGRVYSWEVTAIKEGREITSPVPPSPPARFKVLDQASLDELERARRTYAGSHLLLGVLYANAGLVEDAEREFQALAAANPNSDVAKRLAWSVKSRLLAKERKER